MLDKAPVARSHRAIRMGEGLGHLVHEMLVAGSFEQTAAGVLGSMFRAVEDALDSSPFAGKGRVLRGVVHLRPNGDYEHIYGVERSTDSPIAGPGFVTPGSVWSWIAEHGCAVSIDVQRQALTVWRSDGQLTGRDSGRALPGDLTRERMLGREATHVHALPLRDPRGEVQGMFTIEVSSKSAVGQSFIWDRCHDDLEVFATVGSAFLTARAVGRASPAPTSDRLLPVIGARTARLIEILRAFAVREDTLLLSGPTGAGKSRLARWCHQHSGRDSHPFELLDIHALPEDLQLPELFGWKRGAFTGAIRDNSGAIARAGAGTLFIDEIDKLSLKSQAGLLHFLETGAYRVLGDDTAGERTSRARIIVGTNVDLRAAVRAGTFREDLFWRINVLPVRVPALAERTDEIAAWAAYMLERCHREAGHVGSIGFAQSAADLLQSTAWPGNLRQLDNIVRRAYALAVPAREVGSATTVSDASVREAIGFDHGDSSTQMVAELMDRTARAFVLGGIARAANGGEPWPVELLEGIRGLVLGHATLTLGSKEDAFRTLGMGVLVKNRNHQRALRRELLRARDALVALGGVLDSRLDEMLSEGGAQEA